MKIDKATIIGMLSLFILTMAVYARTLCPTVYTGDSGELISAAYCLGNAHPPGYPLYSILGKIFTLLPFGSIAFRINAMTAFFSALTVMLVYLIILELSALIVADNSLPQLKIFRHISALTGALLLAFSEEFWSGALVTEVFSLNAFLLVLMLLIILKWNGRDRNEIYLACFILGLGFANHITIMMIIPAMVYYIWAESVQGKKVQVKDVSVKCFYLAMFIMAGLMVYIYLPIRASTSPAVNWGDPKTFSSFIKVVTRSQYGTLRLHSEIKTMPSLDTAFKSAAAFIITMFKHFGIVAFLLSIGGLSGMLEKEYKKAWFLIITFILSGVVFFVFANMPQIPMYIDMGRRFYIIPEVLFSITAGLGVLYIFNLTKNKVVGAAVLLPVFLLIGNYQINDRSNNWIAYDHAANTLKTIENNSILFIVGDDFEFPMAYLKIVERARPDVTVYEAYGNIFRNIYGENSSSDTEKEKIRRKLVTTTKNNVYFTKDFNRSGYNTKPTGILYRLVRDSENIHEDMRIWNEYSLRGVYDDRIHKDYRNRIVALRYPYLQGEYYMEKGDKENAVAAFKKACEIGFDVEGVYLDLANIYYYKNMFSEALDIYNRSVKINPYYAAGYNGIGLIYNARSEWDLAIEQFSRAVKNNPNFATGYNNMGIAYFRKGMVNESLMMFEKAIKIDPNCTDAIVNYNSIKEYLGNINKPVTSAQ